MHSLFAPKLGGGATHKHTGQSKNNPQSRTLSPRSLLPAGFFPSLSPPTAPPTVHSPQSTVHSPRGKRKIETGAGGEFGGEEGRGGGRWDLMNCCGTCAGCLRGGLNVLSSGIARCRSAVQLSKTPPLASSFFILQQSNRAVAPCPPPAPPSPTTLPPLSHPPATESTRGVSSPRLLVTDPCLTSGLKRTR